MKAPAVPIVDPRVSAPHQLLAASVIQQAILDLRHPRLTTRAGARAFLAGSDQLTAWCGVLGLDVEIICRRTRQLLTHPFTPPAHRHGRHRQSRPRIGDDPRMTKTLSCVGCGATFALTAGEQRWYGVAEPRRCAPCRAIRARPLLVRRSGAASLVGTRDSVSVA